jgi:heterodisulfide reductase subunit A2
MAYIRPLARAASPRVLVVGGGIAGIQAALDAAALGLPVTLVEEGPSIGGLMAQLDKTFPTNDCAMCILSPRMLEVSRHPHIDIRTLTRVLQVQGQAGDFRVSLSSSPRYVDPARCSGCGECARVCPRKVPDPYNLGLAPTKAIHIPFPQAIPQAAYINPAACRMLQGKKCEACVKSCPARAIDFGQSPQEWVAHAGAIILASGAKPAPATDFPGYEAADVVTSLEFERLLSATGPHGGKLLRPSDQTEPKSIAFIQCVGSRDPRGRGAAYCSTVCCMASVKEALVARELSHGAAASTIFYMDLRAQGKGFETYLEQARSLGVGLVRSRVTAVSPRPEGGATVRYTDLHGRPGELPFDLAVLALGLHPADAERLASLGLAPNAQGFAQADPLLAVAAGREGIFLCGTAREPMDIPGAVTTAAAAAAAASQLLTTSARVLAPTIALPEPGEAACAAPRVGVFLCHCGTNIAKQIDLARLAAYARRLPGVVYVQDPLFACAVESINRMTEVIGSQQLNRVVVAACTPRTHEVVFRRALVAAGLNPGFFAFANIREQCSWVHQEQEAAAQDKAAHLLAMAVHRALVLAPVASQSFTVIPRALVLGGGVAGMSAALSLADQGFHTYLVERDKHLGGQARQLYFTLEGADPQEFLHELQAAVYQHPNIEALTATDLVRVDGHVGQFRSRIVRRRGQGREERDLTHGVILAATGGQEITPTGYYRYGEDRRILTQRQLEAKINAADLELPRVRRVVMIQCVGSRSPERPYCSRLCCQEAVKNALLLKERYPLAEIVVLYRDLRAYGFKELYYQRAKDRGVTFIPFEAARPPAVLPPPRKGALTVRVWDELLGQDLNLAADLVVLSAGLKAPADRGQVARLLKISQTLDGFFQEAHLKLRPVDSASEGIFLCGLAHYPGTLAETVAQAQAAAGRAAAVLFQTELTSGETTARIDSGRCRRCLTCMRLCPFGAVGLRDLRPEISAEVCRGCGLCAAACPAEAIAMSRGTDLEIAVQLEEALRD